jgi:hypothetical protein
MLKRYHAFPRVLHQAEYLHPSNEIGHIVNILANVPHI